MEIRRTVRRFVVRLPKIFRNIHDNREWSILLQVDYKPTPDVLDKCSQAWNEVTNVKGDQQGGGGGGYGIMNDLNTVFRYESVDFKIEAFINMSIVSLN